MNGTVIVKSTEGFRPIRRGCRLDSNRHVDLVEKISILEYIHLNRKTPEKGGFGFYVPKPKNKIRKFG